MKSKRCTLESLSQPCEAYAASQKNSFLQQTKRWLGNKWTDWEGFFLPLAVHFLGKAGTKGELVLILDGSQTGSTHTALMLSVLVRGYAVPLAWLVKKGEKGHFPEQMHLDLLRLILPAIPAACRVVLLGDGEFDGELLCAWCIEHHWEFVVRTSCNRQVDCGVEITRFDALAPAKGHASRFVPNALRGGVNAVCWHDKRFEKPIFLLTNMELGAMACRYYKRRFKIETMFKQLKSKGFQLHKTRLEDADKISSLLIVAAIAFLFTFCLGCFIRHQIPQKTLEIFVRKDKIDKIGVIHLAQLAWDEARKIPLLFFSNLSKNCDWVFS